MTTKRCTRCGLTKQADEFYVKNKATGALQSRCKSCHGEVMKDRYQDGGRERGKAYAAAHRNRNRSAYNAYKAAWRAANPEAEKAIARRADDKRKPTKMAYRVANADRLREQSAEYREANRETIRRQAAEYRDANRAILAERQKQWRTANPEAYSEIHSRWKKANKGLVNAATHRRRMAMRGCSEHHTAAEWEALKEACGFICLCCGRGDVELERDHVQPVSKHGGNAITNLQPLCRACNGAKAAKDTDYREEDILDWLDELVGHDVSSEDVIPSEEESQS